MTLNSERPGQADLLAVGFGTTVAMWAAAYVGRLPLVSLSPVVLFVLFVAIMIAGGAAISRTTLRGVRGGAAVGLIAGLLNLLIIGSLLGGKDGRKLLPGDLATLAPVWIAGTLIAFALLGAAGAALFGRNPSRATLSDAIWRHRFTTAACGATLVVLVAGGVVTGFEAGLAVPDWPNSYGYNMFLFPLAKMTGGIYYEHAHRLAGSLVGLTMLVLAVYIQRREPRVWVRVFAWILFVTVCGQGLLGALRVTGHLTLSDDPSVMAPNLTLAVIHGVLAQAFFAGLVCLRGVLSPEWSSADAAASRNQQRPAAATDRVLQIAAIGMLVIQLILGAILRHFQEGMIIHISMAVIVTAVVAAVGIRAWGLYEDVPSLATLGGGLLILLGVQLALGAAALLAVLYEAPAGEPHPIQVLLTTAHQSTGALLLAAAALLLVLHMRLIRVMPTAPAPASGPRGAQDAATA